MDDGFVSTDAKWGKDFFEVRVPDSSNEIVRIYHSYWRGEEKPNRKWVGLTYEEQETLVELSHSIRDAINRTDWKLKEKNHG